MSHFPLQNLQKRRQGKETIRESLPFLEEELGQVSLGVMDNVLNVCSGAKGGKDNALRSKLQGMSVGKQLSKERC